MFVQSNLVHWVLFFMAHFSGHSIDFGTYLAQSFVPLQTGDSYALGPFTAAIVAHSYDKDSFLGRYSLDVNSIPL